MTTWTAQRVELLKELAKSGLSASQIAAELGGGLTRNAIIGKCQRKNIPLGADRAVLRAARRPGEKKARAPRAKRPPPKPRPSLPDTHYLNVQMDAAACDLPADESPFAVSFDDLGRLHCRWTLGDPSDLRTFRFCGARVHELKPYCVRHCKMSYRPVTRRPMPPVSETERLRRSRQMRDRMTNASRCVSRFEKGA